MPETTAGCGCTADFLNAITGLTPPDAPPEPLVNRVAFGKRITVMDVSLPRAKHLIVSMLFHGSEAPDNPVPADSLTPLHRVLPHESD